MSTITAILEPDAEGRVHLLLPPELRRGKVRLEAKLEAAEPASPPPLATPLMVQQRKEAFAALRAMGGLRHIIPDPVAWQREQRVDRPLPGRD